MTGSEIYAHCRNRHEQNNLREKLHHLVEEQTMSIDVLKLEMNRWKQFRRDNVKMSGWSPEGIKPTRRDVARLISSASLPEYGLPLSARGRANNSSSSSPSSPLPWIYTYGGPSYNKVYNELLEQHSRNAFMNYCNSSFNNNSNTNTRQHLSVRSTRSAHLPSSRHNIAFGSTDPDNINGPERRQVSVKSEIGVLKFKDAWGFSDQESYHHRTGDRCPPNSPAPFTKISRAMIPKTKGRLSEFAKSSCDILTEVELNNRKEKENVIVRLGSAENSEKTQYSEHNNNGNNINNIVMYENSNQCSKRVLECENIERITDTDISISTNKFEQIGMNIDGLSFREKCGTDSKSQTIDGNKKMNIMNISCSFSQISTTPMNESENDSFHRTQIETDKNVQDNIRESQDFTEHSVVRSSNIKTQNDKEKTMLQKQAHELQDYSCDNSGEFYLSHSTSVTENNDNNTDFDNRESFEYCYQSKELDNNSEIPSLICSNRFHKKGNAKVNKIVKSNGYGRIFKSHNLTNGDNLTESMCVQASLQPESSSEKVIQLNRASEDSGVFTAHGTNCDKDSNGLDSGDFVNKNHRDSADIHRCDSKSMRLKGSVKWNDKSLVYPKSSRGITVTKSESRKLSGQLSEVLSGTHSKNSRMHSVPIPGMLTGKAKALQEKVKNQHHPRSNCRNPKFDSKRSKNKKGEKCIEKQFITPDDNASRTVSNQQTKNNIMTTKTTHINERDLPGEISSRCDNQDSIWIPTADLDDIKSTTTTQQLFLDEIASEFENYGKTNTFNRSNSYPKTTMPSESIYRISGENSSFHTTSDDRNNTDIGSNENSTSNSSNKSFYDRPYDDKCNNNSRKTTKARNKGKHSFLNRPKSNRVTNDDTFSNVNNDRNNDYSTSNYNNNSNSNRNNLTFENTANEIGNSTKHKDNGTMNNNIISNDGAKARFTNITTTTINTNNSSNSNKNDVNDNSNNNNKKTNKIDHNVDTNTSRPGSTTHNNDVICDINRRINSGKNTKRPQSEETPGHAFQRKASESSSSGCSKSDDVYHKGILLSNYVSPEQRYKLAFFRPSVGRRFSAKNRTPSFENHDGGSESQNRLVVRLNFSKQARQRALAQLVEHNTSSQSNSMRQALTESLQSRIHQFCVSLQPYIQTTE